MDTYKADMEIAEREAEEQKIETLERWAREGSRPATAEQRKIFLKGGKQICQKRRSPKQA